MIVPFYKSYYESEECKMEFPLHIRDIRQSDPFILADEATHMYYTYAARFNPEQFPWQKRGAFYALASRDLIHWSEPQLVFEKEDFWALLGTRMPHLERALLHNFYLPGRRHLSGMPMPCGRFASGAF